MVMVYSQNIFDTTGHLTYPNNVREEARALEFKSDGDDGIDK